MRVLRKTLLVMLVCLFASAPFDAQAQPSPTVPRLVPVAGVFTPADGRPPAPVETVTLSLHAEQTGGPAIWEEVQSVAVDASGRYSLLLGASLPEGLPLDIFASGEARWLGIRFGRPGEGEAPRARLTSVPYALRAADAETLGGRPASAYLLAPPEGGREAGTAGTPTASTTIVMPSAINTGQTNSVAKYLNNGDTIGPSAMFESSENVGIGTGSSIAVSPSASVDRLNVRFTNTGGTLTGISLRNDGNTNSSYSGLLFYDQNGDLGQFQGFNNGTHEYRINNIARVSPGGAFNGSINFMIGGTSRFKVNSFGQVGIGTAFPLAALNVVRNGPDYADAMFTTFRDDPFPAFLDGARARGTELSPSPVQSGDVLLSLGGSGYGAFGFTRAATIDMVAIGNFSITETPAFIRFSTTPTGATFPSERMRLTEAGNVGIGTPGPADLLHVNGEVRVLNCVKRADGNGIAGACPSDRRFKRDITPFGAVLPAVAALRPVHYYWRATEFPERHFGDGQSYGLIAQEAEEVLPELVVTGPDGYKAVDYSKLPLLTVQAIKELKAENDELKTQSSAMQSRIAELERLVKQLLTDRSRF